MTDRNYIIHIICAMTSYHVLNKGSAWLDLWGMWNFQENYTERLEKVLLSWTLKTEVKECVIYPFWKQLFCPVIKNDTIYFPVA